MPLSKYYKGDGPEVMSDMQHRYGGKKGKSVFYATANKRSLTGQTKKKVRHRPKRKVRHSRARSNPKGQPKLPLGYAQRRFQNLTKR